MKIQDLFEQSRASLFHNLNVGKAYTVFKENKLPASWEHVLPDGSREKGTSLSRNSKMGRDVKEPLFGPIQLVLNQEKLKRNHKLVPLDAEVAIRKQEDDIERAYKFRDRIIRGKEPTTFEEEFIVGDVNNLHQYLEKIIWVKEFEDEKEKQGCFR